MERWLIDHEKPNNLGFANGPRVSAVTYTVAILSAQWLRPSRGATVYTRWELTQATAARGPPLLPLPTQGVPAPSRDQASIRQESETTQGTALGFRGLIR